MHARERLRHAGIPPRFYQTATVVGPGGSGVLPFPYGITVSRVTNGVVDDGTFLPFDPITPQR